MFEFYNDLSVLGKLIFYFSILIIICSIFYQCSICRMLPVRLAWNYPEESQTNNKLVSVPSNAIAVVVPEEESANNSAELQQQLQQQNISAEMFQDRSRQRIRDPNRQFSPSNLRKRTRISARNSPATRRTRNQLKESPKRQRINKNNKSTLILFYADWCSHCKNFKPKWNKLTKTLEGIIKTASVNGDTNQQMMQKYNVDKFPTIILDNGSTKLEYDGDMTIEGLKQFVLTQQNNGSITQNFVV
jgi:thiol-disulfide isomerase/thioredoxin